MSSPLLKSISMNPTALPLDWTQVLMRATVAVGLGLTASFHAGAANAASSNEKSAKSANTLNSVLAGSSGALPTTDAPVPAGLIQLPPASRYYSPYAFVVDKTARVLTVWHQTGNGLQEVASFPADLGKAAGDKRGQGDHKTPEGIYFLQTRLDGSQIDFKLYGKRAFTTDYPNFFDRTEGKTGNGIWLHAVPDDVALTRGSRGCVVVRNNVILDLTQYVTLGRTPILIQNKTERLPPAELNRVTNELFHWVEDWRTAWASKDIERYISFYGDDFKSMNMNREKWRQHKSNLNSMYKEIEVKMSKPAILADRDRAVVRFLQEYTSDKKSDFGEKVLYLKREGGQYRIVGEQWTEETSQIAREEIEATTGGAKSQARSQSRGQAALSDPQVSAHN
jgi:murein L,D-transpeptidase YafK